jgi:hypothetical protein
LGAVQAARCELAAEFTETSGAPKPIKLPAGEDDPAEGHVYEPKANGWTKVTFTI